MKKLFICLWIMIAIVVQSVVAIKDSTIDLAIAINHAQEKHVHKAQHHDQQHHLNVLEKVSPISDINLDNSDNLSSNSTDEQHSHAGCHHCGHCTTPHVFWHVNTSLFAIDTTSEINFSIENFTLSDVIDNTYRPPIV